MAADTDPLEMLMNIPTICEEKVINIKIIIETKYYFY